MSETINTTVYDLEERTFQFAKNIRYWIKSFPNTISNLEDGKQLIRASGSVGANYIEANESLSKKDFSYRIKICLKESKECIFWIRLLLEFKGSISNIDKGQMLLQEATELKKIFSGIVIKSK